MLRRLTSPAKPFDLVTALKGNQRTVASLTCLLLLVFSPLIFVNREVSYIATGTLRFSPARLTFLSKTDEGPTGYDFFNYLQTQAARLSQPSLLAEALDAMPVDLRNDFVPEGLSSTDVSDDLSRALRIDQLANTHLINLKMTGHNKDSVTELVNSVMTVYLKMSDLEEQGKDNRRLEALEQEYKQLADQVNETSDQLHQMSAQGGSSQLDSISNLYQYKWDALNKALVEAEQKALTAKDTYEATLKRVAAMRQVPLKSAVAERAEANAVVSGARTIAQTHLRELQEQTERLAVGSPDRKILDVKTESLKAYMHDLEEGAAKASATVIEGKRDIELQQLVIDAQYTHDTAQSILADLKTQVDILDSEMGSHFEAFEKARNLNADLTAKQALLKEMESRIYKLKVESQSPGRVDIDERARTKETSNTMRLLAVWLAASFGLAAGFVALRVKLNPLITDRKDVELAAGAPPSWPIPHYAPVGKAGIPFTRMTIEDPSCPAAIAVRSLALKLTREHKEGGAQVVVFSGIGSEVGTSSIVINTAHSLRLILNRILIIDLNRHHPQLATLLNADAREWSVLQVLNGHQPLTQSIFNDQERQIDCLFMPPEATSPDVNMRAVPDLIHAARRDYDMILIDSAPLLDSELTELLVHHCDIIAPVIRGHHTYYAELHHTVQLLLRLKVKAIAPVLNWYRPKRVPQGKSPKEAKSELASVPEPMLAGE